MDFQYEKDSFKVSYSTKGPYVSTDTVVVSRPDHGYERVDKLTAGEKRYIQEKIDDEFKESTVAPVKEVGDFICKVYYNLNFVQFAE